MDIHAVLLHRFTSVCEWFPKKHRQFTNGSVVPVCLSVSDVRAVVLAGFINLYLSVTVFSLPLRLDIKRKHYGYYRQDNTTRGI